MKKLILMLSVVSLLIGGCATQQQTNCGTKAQKKAKHKSMKSGKSPGGGMLSK
jgi:uncharacterized lipoprotein YajG